MATLLQLSHPQSAPALTGVRPIRLKVFDGTTDYAQHRTSSRILLARASDEVKLQSLVGCLAGEADAFLHTLPEALRNSYDAVDQALSVEYGQRQSRSALQTSWQTCRQRANESVRAFARRLRAIHRQTFSSIADHPEAESCLLTFLFNGLRDDMLRRDGKRQRFADFNTAVDWLAEEEPRLVRGAEVDGALAATAASAQAAPAAQPPQEN